METTWPYFGGYILGAQPVFVNIGNKWINTESILKIEVQGKDGYGLDVTTTTCPKNCSLFFAGTLKQLWATESCRPEITPSQQGQG